MSPATSAVPPAASTSARSRIAAVRLSSSTRSPWPLSRSRARLPPKVLVNTICEPASRYPRWMRRMTSGWARFQTSGGSPNWRPLAKSIVPIAPSATIVPPWSRSARNFALAAPPSRARRVARSGNAARSTSAAGPGGSAAVPFEPFEPFEPRTEAASTRRARVPRRTLSIVRIIAIDSAWPAPAPFARCTVTTHRPPPPDRSSGPRGPARPDAPRPGGRRRPR